MKFRQITFLDPCGITADIRKDIEKLAENPLRQYADIPGTDQEIINRIGDSDAVLLSWQTALPENVLKACPALRFIGLCGSLYDDGSANIDLRAARELGITVKGVKDYGDHGAVEFIFARLITLFKGEGPVQWSENATELGSKTIGIIGLGTLGTMVGETARHFGMQVYYYNRSRKPAAEAAGMQYLPLNELLERCDIVSTHLPKHTCLLGAEQFSKMKPKSVLINTSLGHTFSKPAFLDWIGHHSGSFAIFDADGAGDDLEEFSAFPNVMWSDQFAGFTAEARIRLSEKMLVNLSSYLSR